MTGIVPFTKLYEISDNYCKMCEGDQPFSALWLFSSIKDAEDFFGSYYNFRDFRPPTTGYMFGTHVNLNWSYDRTIYTPELCRITSSSWPQTTKVVVSTIDTVTKEYILKYDTVILSNRLSEVPLSKLFDFCMDDGGDSSIEQEIKSFLSTFSEKEGDKNG